MKKVLLMFALLLLPAAVQAQVQVVPTQQSNAAEGSHIFSGTQLDSLTVNWNGATTARYLIIFDATALPSNGAITSCTNTTTPAAACWVYCAYINNSGTAPGSASFTGFPAIGPSRNGAFVAAMSTGAGCATLTVDGANDFFVAQVQ